MTDLDASRPPLDPPLPNPARLPLRGRVAAGVLLAMLGAGGAIALVLPGAGLGPVALAGGGLGVCGVLVLRGLARGYPHRRFGLANAITLGRAAGVAVLAASLVAAPMDEAARWALTGLAAMIFALDGVDGWAARRTGLASGFGARFDMEVDSAFALVLALMVWRAGDVGVWVVALGLFRPVFLLAGRAWPPLAAALPEARWRKGVCVVQIGALIALIAPPMPAGAAPWVAGAVLAMLVVSFARDVRWLARNGRAEGHIEGQTSPDADARP